MATLIKKIQSYFFLNKFLVSLFLSILGYATLMSYISILKHELFLSTAWDLGIYEQVIWSTVNGKFFWYTVELPINPNGCFFGIHFSPVLFLVLPLYWLFQSTATLLILQSFVLAFAAFPLYLIGLNETNNPKYAFVFSILYLVYPPLLGVYLFDFHAQAFLPLFFFCAFYYFNKKDFPKCLLFIILSLSVIEFVPFLVIFFGLYGLWVVWKENRSSCGSLDFNILLNKTLIFSIFTIILGVVWYIISRKVMFFFNPTVPPHPNWQEFGDPVHNPLGLLWNLVSNPIRTLQCLFSPFGEKILYLIGILSPVAFLSLFDLPSFSISLPWFLIAFLSNYPPYYTAIGNHYVAFVTPFIFISAVLGGKRFLSFFSSRLRGNKIMQLRYFNYFFKGTGKKILVLSYALLIIFSYTLSIQKPYIENFSTKLSSRNFEHRTVLNTFIDCVPQEAAVITQNDIFPHLSRKMNSYVMWEPLISNTSFSAVDFFLQNVSVDYILIDTTSEWYLDNLENFTATLIENGTFGIMSSTDYVWLLKKGYKDDPLYFFENGLNISLYNQGLAMTVYNGSSSNENELLKGITLNISVSDALLQTLNPYIGEVELRVAWSGQLFIPVEGNYSFYVLSDSMGSRKLCIDNNTILDYEGTSAKTMLSFGFHSLKFEYVITGKSESMFLFWKPPWEDSPRVLSSEFLYANSVPNVSSIVLSPSFSFGYKSPFPTIKRDHFSAFIRGYFKVESAGFYNFTVDADDGAMVYVDGSLVFNSYAPLNNTNTFELLLDSGWHEILIFYFETEGNAMFCLMWQYPGKDNFEEFPLSIFSWKR